MVSLPGILPTGHAFEPQESRDSHVLCRSHDILHRSLVDNHALSMMVLEHGVEIEDAHCVTQTPHVLCTLHRMQDHVASSSYAGQEGIINKGLSYTFDIHEGRGVHAWGILNHPYFTWLSQHWYHSPVETTLASPGICAADLARIRAPAARELLRQYSKEFIHRIIQKHQSINPPYQSPPTNPKSANRIHQYLYLNP
ncbi:hypothetical protein BDV97DRAFT_168507 [Delphinella strobiligena]|nr:hypothetical protein BDV97DRAFT_168507 [Delphinella strobiligena]